MTWEAWSSSVWLDVKQGVACIFASSVYRTSKDVDEFSEELRSLNK